MLVSFAEAQYPISFRKDIAVVLGKYIRNRQSVELIGMKRVGISNFLRFFLYHKNIIPTYVSKEQKHIFITVNVNDLIELDIFPFWKVFLKRIIDSVEYSNLSLEAKNRINKLFISNLQINDLFLTIEACHEALSIIVNEGYYPTVFILIFDRLQDAVSKEFFANLKHMTDRLDNRLSYIFTSYRTLNELAPQIFLKPALSTFCQTMYVKPASKSDMQIILKTFEKKYHLQLSSTVSEKLIALSGGHIQYLQLSLIIINENVKHHNKKLSSLDERQLLNDERVILQSEEIFTSLTPEEQEILKQIYIEKKDKDNGFYLYQTGILNKVADTITIFNTYFRYYLDTIFSKTQKQQSPVLTKKEKLLYEFLTKHFNQVCERSTLQEAIWPEYSEIGISDWAIDRLVYRLRIKLEALNNKQQIVTVRSRGFMLNSVSGEVA